MVETYRVLAWDATTVRVGTLRGPELDVMVIPTDTRFSDIRNCSAPPQSGWALVAGVDTATGAHTMWRLETSSGGSTAIVEADFLLHAAVDPTSSRVMYTAPPSRARSDTSLHLLELATSVSQLLVEGTVESSCVPSWRTPDRVLFHTVERNVVELDLNLGQQRWLFVGEHPAASPDGGQIAYRVGAAVLLTSAGGQPADVSPRRGVLPREYRGGMSWSPDGRMLLLARSGGALGYELDFLTLDVGTGETVKIRQRYLRGMVFMR